MTTFGRGCRRPWRQTGSIVVPARATTTLSLLAGLIYDAHGEPMTPSHAVKRGVRYRYYVSKSLVTGGR